ncbi:hypothetical protein MAR_033664 [Mya arenaria]|uniref:Uncharacterized protein n=1 Tax=Mya arenaria TaxID=6604 RepID=A0ABY7GCP0_MYAAR|nr:hypothetical protein MAR_033664 [Mya arenaria]
MQRVYTFSTVKSAKMMFLLSMPICAPLVVIAVLEGGRVSLPTTQHDIFASGKVQNVNEIVPFTIIDVFRNQPGLPGLFITALSAAAFICQQSCIRIYKVNQAGCDPRVINKYFTYCFPGFRSVSLARVIPADVTTWKHRRLVPALCGLHGRTHMRNISPLSNFQTRATTKGVLLGPFDESAVASWLNLGQLYSYLPKDPPLPPGPTYNCENNMTFNEQYD